MPIFSYADLHTDKNVPKTKEIFCEHNDKGILTYSRDDKPGKINLYKLYMSFCVEDPSEVKFAEEVFGDIGFWLRLQNAVFFKETLTEWRQHAAEKRKCLAFEAIIKEVKNDGKSSFTAAKYLIEEPWRNGNSVAEKKRLKAEIEKTATNAFISKSAESDYQRLKDEGILN